MEVLNDAILDEFLTQLRRLGAPVAETLVAGLSDVEIDAVLKPLEIDLPEEARVWWRWRNGTDPGAPDAETLFSDRHFRSLQDEASLYREMKALDQDEYQYPTFLQPVDQRPHVFFDCRGPRNAPVPIYWNDIENPIEILPSIGALVRRWIDVMRSGYVSVDQQGIWHYHEDKRPPDDQLIGFE